MAYDRIICLRDGHYHFNFGSHLYTTHISLKVNGNYVQRLHRSASSQGGASYGSVELFLKRGDYVQREGGYESNGDSWWSLMECRRLRQGV